MHDTAHWLAWRNSSLFEATDPSSGESSLEVSPENGPALPELRTAQNLSLPVQPELLSQQLDSLLQWHLDHHPHSPNTNNAPLDLASMFPIAPGAPQSQPPASASPDLLSTELSAFAASSSDATLQPLSPAALELTLQSAETPTSTSGHTTTSTGAPSKRRGSTASSSSAALLSSSQPLTASDKRARNTEASKRFRANRKAREEESKRRVAELSDENDSLQQRVSSLERENALLRSLITGRSRSSAGPDTTPAPSIV